MRRPETLCFFRPWCFSLPSLEQCVLFAADFLNGKVCAQDQYKADNALVNACCGRSAVIVQRDECAVNVRINRARNVEQRAGIHRHLIEQTEIGIENSSDAEEQQGDDGRNEARQCDFRNLLPFACTVQSCSLIEGRIDTDQGCDVNQASVSYVTENTDEAAKLIGDYDIVPEAVAKKALPACNIVCITGDEMKEKLSGYLGVLKDQNPETVGGELPGDDFYYSE